MIRYSKDANNIVNITLDMVERPTNVINHEMVQIFEPVMRKLKLEKSRGKLKGVIISSSKKDFLRGGDLDYLHRIQDEKALFDATQALKKLLRDLESPNVPVVAIINGLATGTGFEFALGCHHRIMIDDSKARVGMTEINIGLIPAAGGVIRLMWLLGIEAAYHVLISGKRFTTREALKAGLIDEIADDEKKAHQQAVQWLLNTHEGRRPWDQQMPVIPYGNANDPTIAAVIRRLAAEQVEKYQHNYPAPKAILQVLTDGSKVGFDTALLLETRAFIKLVKEPSSRNMMKAFWTDLNYIRYGQNRPKGYGKFRPRKIGVVGAGLMGTGIATACLANGMQVVLKDVSKSVADRGVRVIHSNLGRLEEAGTLTPGEHARILPKLKGTDNVADFAECDLVIEAVFENRNVKQKVTREAESFLDEYSIFASNTVSIPISELAEASQRPENYVGLHFFAPAETSPLVEIVRGTRTSEETVARAFDFVRTLHKVPIIVKDVWGFYAARVRNTYILEGITMLQEGYPASLIENMGRQAGMEQGPLSLADDLGLNLIYEFEKQAARHYGTKYRQHPAVAVLENMLEVQNRPGKHKKAGFFEYRESGERTLWGELDTIYPITITEFDSKEIKERLLFVQVLEALWCRQEKVVVSTAAANIGSIFGFGFPASKGGVIQFIEDYGKEAFVEACKSFRTRFGQRFWIPMEALEQV